MDPPPIPSSLGVRVGKRDHGLWSFMDLLFYISKSYNEVKIRQEERDLEIETFTTNGVTESLRLIDG